MQGPESIADHMYRMGMMAMLVQGTGYDYVRQGDAELQKLAGTNMAWLTAAVA